MTYSVVWSANKLARMCERKINNNFDVVCVIEGTTGIGKSTLAIQIARKVKFHHFKLSKDLIYTQEELIYSLKNRWKQAFISDEAINVAFNRDFYQENQKNILKLFNMNRDHTNLIILCVPNFEDLDVKLKSLCRLRISVIERGVGIVQMKNPSIFCRDKWDSQINERMEREWLSKGYSPRYSKLTTFRGFVKFRPLPKKVEEIYNRIKTRKRSEIYSKQELLDAVSFKSPSDKMLKALLEGKIRNQEEFVTYADLLDIEVSSAMQGIRKRLKEMGASERLKDFFTDNINNQIKKLEKDRVTIDKLLKSI